MNPKAKRYFLRTHLDNPVSREREAGAGFDAKKFGDILEASGTDAVYCYTKDLGGYSYYYTDVGNRHPKLRSDLLTLEAEELKRRGMKLITYMSGAWDGTQVRLHPDWEFTKLDGSHPDFIEFKVTCLYNSPFVEESLLPQCREIVEKYKLDSHMIDTMDYIGICFCDNCKKRFKAETGLEMPAKDGDPGEKYLRDFAVKLRWEFADKMTRELKKLNPDLVMSCNWMFCAINMPYLPPAGLDCFFGDHGPAADAYSNIYVAQYWSGMEMPYEIMIGRGVHNLTNPTIRPAEMMERDFAIVAAGGGICTTIDIQHPDGSLDEEAHRTIGRVNKFLRAHFNGIMDTENYKDVAVLHDSDTHMGKTFTEICNTISFRNWPAATNGAARSLSERGIGFGIVNEQKLLDDIDNYRAVIIPEQFDMNTGLLRRIGEYVSAGGTVIASYPFGRVMESSNTEAKALIEKIFGIELIGNNEDEFAFIEFGDELRNAMDTRHVMREKWCEPREMTPLQIKPRVIRKTVPGAEGVTGFTALVRATEAQTLASLNLLDKSWKKHFTWNEPFFLDAAPHSPGVTVNSYGKGKAIFIASPVYHLLAGRYDPIIVDLTEALLSMSRKPAEIVLDGPPNVYMSLRRHGDAVDIHLVDITGLKSPVVDYIGNIDGISIKLNRKPSEVKSVSGAENITVDGNTVTVKRLHIHDCISVKF